MEGRVSGYWYWLLTLFVLQTILTIVFFLECWFSLLVLLYSLLISCTFTLLSAVSSVERAGGGEQEYTFLEVGAGGIWAGLGGAIGEEAWILFHGSGLRSPAWGEVQAGTTLCGFADNIVCTHRCLYTLNLYSWVVGLLVSGGRVAEKSARTGGGFVRVNRACIHTVHTLLGPLWSSPRKLS